MVTTRKFIASIKEWNPEFPLSVMGSTGSGKTDCVLSFLRKNSDLAPNTLLVSVDAVSLYKKLDIGSAKAMGADRNDFLWSGLDIFEPTQEVNLADYTNIVSRDISQHLETQKPIVFVGGSHFYERALIMGQSVGQASDPAYQQELEALTNEVLYQRLLKVDARWADKVHENDRYRLTRYLDLSDRQELKFDDIFSPPKRHVNLRKMNDEVQCLTLGLDSNVEQTRDKLGQRVKGMFKTGWIDEVKELLKEFPPQAPGLQTLGYKEIVEHLAGKLTFAECEELIWVGHCQLAKKQRTWLRGLLAQNAKKQEHSL